MFMKLGLDPDKLKGEKKVNETFRTSVKGSYQKSLLSDFKYLWEESQSKGIKK